MTRTCRICYQKLPRPGEIRAESGAHYWWPAPQETNVRFDHTDIVAAAFPVGRQVPRDAADARHAVIAPFSADCVGAMSSQMGNHIADRVAHRNG
jgi:hypothetical protein